MQQLLTLYRTLGKLATLVIMQTLDMDNIYVT